MPYSRTMWEFFPRIYQPLAIEPVEHSAPLDIYWGHDEQRAEQILQGCASRSDHGGHYLDRDGIVKLLREGHEMAERGDLLGLKLIRYVADLLEA